MAEILLYVTFFKYRYENHNRHELLVTNYGVKYVNIFM